MTGSRELEGITKKIIQSFVDTQLLFLKAFQKFRSWEYLKNLKMICFK